MGERLNVVLEAPHNPAERWHQWVYLPGFRGVPGEITRDVRGRKHRNGGTRWLVLVCNEPRCDARALVRASLLEDAAEVALPVPNTKAHP